MEIKTDGICTLLQVFDMNASIFFYCNVLGFELYQSAGPEEDKGWVWLKKGNIELMLNTAYETSDRPLQPDPSRVAVHSDTCIYIGCLNIDQAYDYLLSKGIQLSPPTITHYGMKQMYLLDPDGYSLCFQWSVTPDV